jgi:hypothetical protein
VTQNPKGTEWLKEQQISIQVAYLPYMSQSEEHEISLQLERPRAKIVKKMGVTSGGSSPELASPLSTPSNFVHDYKGLLLEES